MKIFLKTHYKKISVIVAILLALFTINFVMNKAGLKGYLGAEKEGTSIVRQEILKTEQKLREEAKVRFTHKIFDPELVSHIIPLGELNGGYDETQTINGLAINIKMDAKWNAPEINVYAPTDMTLEEYSYFGDGKNTPNWHLGFRISKDMVLGLDHITWVSDEMKAATPPTVTSATHTPKKKFSFKAGDIIAKTSGTDRAHNWNIYLRDNKVTNSFVNHIRYEKVKDSYSYLNAACPFDYYEDAIKQQFIVLMGATKAGQSKTCGTNSRDVKGSISGLWHLAKDGVSADYQGQYATPFSIYKDSAENIILYEINRKRYILGATNKTYKDPAAVTASHCYNLTEYGEDRTIKGYAFFEIISDMEMKIAVSAVDPCPSTFPESQFKTYYR